VPSYPATIQPDAIAHGHHVCGLYASRAEQEELVAEFVRTGLARGDGVRCVVHDLRPDDLLDWLAADGVPVSEAIEVVPSSDAYLVESAFDPDRMIAVLHEAVDDALADGFRGFRVTGDMSWALESGVMGADRLEEYEARAADVYATRPAAGLCLYDRRRFETDGALGLHAAVARLPAISPDGQLRIHRLDGEGLRLRVAGEADLGSSPALAAALAEAVDGDVHVDLTRLRFMDLSATRVLAEFGGSLERSRKLVIHGPSPSVRRVIDILGPYLACAELSP